MIAKAPKNTLFCCENAFVAIDSLFSDNKCALFAGLGGGVAERARYDHFLPFVISGLFYGGAIVTS